MPEVPLFQMLYLRDFFVRQRADICKATLDPVLLSIHIFWWLHRLPHQVAISSPQKKEPAAIQSVLPVVIPVIFLP